MLLTADAAYTLDHWNEKALPGFLTSTIDAVRSVQKLHQVVRQSGAQVVTGHDPEAWPTFKKRRTFTIDRTFSQALWGRACTASPARTVRPRPDRRPILIATKDMLIAGTGTNVTMFSYRISVIPKCSSPASPPSLL
jgi:hypothetical protein